MCVRAPICDVSLTEAEEARGNEKGVLTLTSAEETAPYHCALFHFLS